MKASLSVRMSSADAHYGGGLVSGARFVELWHEGLFAGYSSVEFLAPVRAGDFIEATGEIVRTGNTSREMRFEAHRYAAARPEVSGSAAEVLAEPELVARATGTCVVPHDPRRPGR